MNKEILKLAVPNVISNLSIPFLSTVDTLLMGQLSALHLAAVGIATMIFNFFYWNFGFLRMGTTGMTAQAYGRKANKEYSLVLFRALFLAGIIALILILLNEYVLRSSSYLLNVEDSYSHLVARYFKIRIIAAPATLGLYAILGWYFGMQNAWIPMVVTILINVLNIVVSISMVKYWDMGIDGVAWGTVIAQYAGLLTAVLFLFRFKDKIIRVSWEELLHLDALGKFLDINKDIFLRTIGLTFAFAFFYSQSAKGGAVVLAVMVVLLQFLNWMSFFIDGFAYAAESLVGKYFGANNKVKLDRAVNYSLVWGAGLALVFSLVYYVFGDYILHIFTNDVAVITKADSLMKWTILMPIAGFLAYIWDGIFIGMTKAKAMRNSMLLSLTIYLILFYTVPLNTMDWFWISFLIFLLSRGVIQSFQYYGWIRNSKKEEY